MGIDLCRGILMKISVIGLGYVGTVSAACLSEIGHQVVGVDVNPTKVEAINAGRSPVIEPGLEEALQRVVTQGRLRATAEVSEAILGSDVSLICVGTPSQKNGALGLDYVLRVTRQIGEALAEHPDYHVVAFRSTMLPGTVEDQLIPILEAESGKRAGEDFGVVMNPEFLREGTSLKDFHDPPRIVIGEFDARCGDRVLAAYAGIEAPIVRTSLRSAEMLKYVDNSFHALKIAFANEIGNICKSQEIDAREVMANFCLDTKLNLSPVYLKPGAAFGGSCLPKDLRALLYHARSQDLEVPVLEAILPSNEQQKDRAFALIEETGKKKVGLLGLSFKAGTDDLRESPAVQLAERLIGKGYDLAIFDRNVALARLVGANRFYIEQEIPHIASLMRESLTEVKSFAEVLVVTTPDPEFQCVAQEVGEGRILVDLVGIFSGEDPPAEVRGISW